MKGYRQSIYITVDATLEPGQLMRRPTRPVRLPVPAVPCVGIGGHSSTKYANTHSSHLRGPASASITHTQAVRMFLIMVCHPSSSKSFNHIPSRVTRRPWTVANVPSPAWCSCLVGHHRLPQGWRKRLSLLFTAVTAQVRICIPHHLATTEDKGYHELSLAIASPSS
jgi:hypothetical protein